MSDTANAEPVEAETNGDERTPRRTRLAIPRPGQGQKITHDSIVSAEVLDEHDRADDTRAARAAAILSNGKYDGRLTHALLRFLQPLLDEPINPRYIVTTGPAEAGKPMVTTGIQSIQVQVDRLAEVLGLAHYRLLPYHVDGGQRCRMHVVIGNDLRWCRLTPEGELQPYTILAETAVSPASGAVYADMRDADVLAHADGWGGHARGRTPSDFWKGSETNAGKRVIARVGPGRHVYRLDFEDDPHADPAAPQASSAARHRPQASKPPATQQQAEGEPEEVLERWLAKDDDLKPLREKLNEAMERAGAKAEQRARFIARSRTKADLEREIAAVNSYLDGASS